MRFEESWTNFEECRELLTQHWPTLGNLSGEVYSTKLSCCMRELHKWNRDILRGSLKGAIASKKEEIRRVQMRGSSNWRHIALEAEKDLEWLLEEEEIYWRQRARKDWIQWGDRNTKWFHLRASQRRKTNRVKGLVSANGRWTDDDIEMSAIATSYFIDLFKPTDPPDNETGRILDSIPTNITK